MQSSQMAIFFTTSGITLLIVGFLLVTPKIQPKRSLIDPFRKTPKQDHSFWSVFRENLSCFIAIPIIGYILLNLIEFLLN